MTDPQAALEAISVSKRYRRGGVWALKDVDLQVAPGTITALVGPNGAGKTTLIRSFVGFERPTTGSVRVMGIDPAVDRTEAISRLGFVSQSSGLYRGLSVSDHLDLAATLRRGFDRATAAARLEQFGIPLAQRAGDLSGGQAAQVTLSIALGTHAPILLLDEPLASLDPLARRDFLGVLLDEVHGRGATCVLSSHMVSDVESVCDSIIVLGSGKVALHSPIDSALAEHRLIADQPPDGTSVIASFGRPGGEPVFLARSSDPGLPLPSLDELVMGYLAASRAAGTGFQRAA